VRIWTSDQALKNVKSRVFSLDVREPKLSVIDVQTPVNASPGHCIALNVVILPIDRNQSALNQIGILNECYSNNLTLEIIIAVFRFC